METGVIPVGDVSRQAPQAGALGVSSQCAVPMGAVLNTIHTILGFFHNFPVLVAMCFFLLVPNHEPSVAQYRFLIGYDIPYILPS